MKMNGSSNSAVKLWTLKTRNDIYKNSKSHQTNKDWTGNWETRVQSPVWAKSLTPGLALINHFYEMIISVRIDCCADTWLEFLLYSFIQICQWKNQVIISHNFQPNELSYSQYHIAYWVFEIFEQQILIIYYYSKRLFEVLIKNKIIWSYLESQGIIEPSDLKLGGAKVLAIVEHNPSKEHQRFFNPT